MIRAKRTRLRSSDVVGKKIPKVIGETGLYSILPHIKAALTGHCVEYEMSRVTG
jgi:hypothetical protein